MVAPKNSAQNPDAEVVAFVFVVAPPTAPFYESFLLLILESMCVHEFLIVKSLDRGAAHGSPVLASPLRRGAPPFDRLASPLS